MVYNGIKYYIAGAGYYMNSKGKYLHHQILPPKKGFIIDHINRNKLDNRPENLRYVTVRQNTINTTSNKGLPKNVFVDSKRRLSKPYRILFNIEKKNYHFGRYESLKEAAHIAQDINNQLLEYDFE